MAAGSIVIDLLMRTGSFETDTKRASKALRDFQREAVESVTRASTALLGLAGAAAGAFLALERGAAAIGRFKDLGDVIGDTGEAVASLQTASDVSGTSLDTVTAASVKLTAALSKTDDESQGAAAALAALDLQLEEFKRLSPVQQIDAVSKALAGFRDNARQTEIAVALFGKAGAQLLPFLKELSAQGGPRVIISQDQIEAADKFGDSVALLRSQVTQLGQSVLADLLPPFQAFVEELGEADRALSIFSVAGEAVRIFFETIAVLGANLIFILNAAGKTLGGFVAAMEALRQGDIKGFFAISRAVKEDTDRARAELDRFEQRILGASQNAATQRQQRRLEDRGFDPRPEINTSGLVQNSDRENAAKRLLDNQVKALEAVIRREQDLLGERNRFLNLFNEQGLVSIRDYYEAQIAIIESATAAQIAAIDKQIALTQAARAKVTKDSDRADLSGKVDELVAKRAKTEQDAGAKAIELAIRREQAEKKFAQQIDTTRASVLELQGSLAAAAAIRFDTQNQELIARAAAEGNTQLQGLLATLRQASIEQAKFAEGADLRQINASVLELQGNLGAAAAIRFDEQNFALVERLTKQGNTEALKLVQTLRQATIAQAEFGKASENTQRVLDSLAIGEDRIAIGRQLGATTELGALRELGVARQAALRQLEAMVEAQEAIARASANPALIQSAERARVELERLRATADPLGDKFRTIFADASTSGIETFLNDVSRGKDAVKAFADSVQQQINRLIAQNISESLFGKQGIFGGLVGSFGQALGGGGASVDAGGAAAKAAADTSAAAATTALSASATAASASVATLAPATAPAITSFASLAAAAEIAAAALAQIAQSQATSSAASIFGGAFATGGPPPVGRVSVAGEQGRELFVRGSASQARQAIEAMVHGAAPVSGMALIGQNGPQFFRPTVPGYVVPAEETEAILRRISGFGGAYQWGGAPPVGMGSLGGEDGRELFIPRTAGLKPPENDQAQQGKVTNFSQVNNFMPQGQITRATQSQITTDVGRAAQSALARGNA